MLLHRLATNPALCLRIAVYLSAALVFPLHLGWVGASWTDLGVYLVIASLLLSTPVALLVEPLAHPRWQAMAMVAVANMVMSTAPAALAFSLGSALGPLDEALDAEMCAAQGLAEVDTAAAEANDTVDVIPDCR